MVDTGALPPRASAAGISARFLFLAAMLLLLVGAVGGGWAMSRLAPARLSASLAPTPAIKAAVPADPDRAAGFPATGGPAPMATAPAGLADRVGELEARLRAISTTANAATGNAARAEGLLIVFAARRALDRGLALGYLENQLRMRFGAAQPNAVRTVVDAARTPVTLQSLRSDLDQLAPALVGRKDGTGSVWTGVRREFSELFILRDAAMPSQRAADRLDRARRQLDADMTDRAIAEVEAMPGAADAIDWLIAARRYDEARRALDLIETAAILEGGGGPAPPSAGPDRN